MLLTLPGGTRVRVRPIAPEDKPLLSDGLRRLSPETAFRRFMSPKVSFSEAELRYLTEVDQVDHIALVAVAAGDPTLLIAVARCVRRARPPGHGGHRRGRRRSVAGPGARPPARRRGRPPRAGRGHRPDL